MKKTNLSVSRTRPAILFAALAGVLLPSATFAQAAASDLRGSATAVSGIAMGASLSLVNSGTLSVASGAQEASSVGESVSGVFSAGALHATAIGQANMAATETSVADISVSEGGFLFA